MSRVKCRFGKHNDRVLKGGKKLECTICGDRFPCDDPECGHFDCAWERDEPWVVIGKELGFEK